MNCKRDYKRIWWPAVYVGAGRLHGQCGEARHVDGDTWRFEYIGVGCDAYANAYDVFRTEIDIEAVGCK